MPRRTGTTLIEVLIAIFVMAIGLIALLTLFPIGALRMARAIQDDQCALAVANANSIATIKNIRKDSAVVAPNWAVIAYSKSVDVFTNPLGKQRLPADPDGPSYPVFVDPIGVLYSVYPSNQYLAGKLPIVRTSTSFTTSTTTCFNWCALLDDYVFDTDENSTGTGGHPYNFGPPRSSIIQPIIRREIRYTWAYLLQRPRASDPSIVTCSVVVYNKRPLALTSTPSSGSSPLGILLGLSEHQYDNVAFNPASNSIVVNWFNSPEPNVNPGDWLLDCTKVQTTNAQGQTFGTAHGFFYRVVGATRSGTTQTTFEVQQPIRGFPSPQQPASTAYPGSIITLEGVADVYERGLDRKLN